MELVVTIKYLQLFFLYLRTVIDHVFRISTKCIFDDSSSIGQPVSNLCNWILHNESAMLSVQGFFFNNSVLQNRGVRMIQEKIVGSIVCIALDLAGALLCP